MEGDGVDGIDTVAQSVSRHAGGKTQGGDFLGGFVAGDGVLAFLVSGSRAVEEWIHRPRRGGSPVAGRARADVELSNRGRTLAQRGAEAVGAGIAAADDYHFLATRRDSGLFIVALIDSVLPGQVLHGREDAGELAAVDRQVPGNRGARGENYCVEGGEVRGCGGDSGAKLGALFFHLGDAAIDPAVIHLVFGHAVAHEPAETIITLKDGDLVTCASQLLSCGQAGGPRAHDGDCHAGHERGPYGLDPVLVKGPFDNGQLNVFDCHGIVIDAEHAGSLAGGWAQAASELREVIGRVEPVVGLTPAVLTHEIVPLGNNVAQRTALVAEGDAAVHATSGLLFDLAVGGQLIDFAEVEQAQRHGAVCRFAAVILLESMWIGHYFTASMIASLMSRPSWEATSMTLSTRR